MVMAPVFFDIFPRRKPTVGREGHEGSDAAFGIAVNLKKALDRVPRDSVEWNELKDMLPYVKEKAQHWLKWGTNPLPKEESDEYYRLLDKINTM